MRVNCDFWFGLENVEKKEEKNVFNGSSLLLYTQYIENLFIYLGALEVHIYNNN